MLEQKGHIMSLAKASQPLEQVVLLYGQAGHLHGYSFQCILDSTGNQFHLSRWNGAKELLELVTWLASLPRPGQKLANSFLVALLGVSGQLGERLIGDFIRGSNLKGGVGQTLTNC